MYMIDMWELVKSGHEGQVDRGGKAYINHLVAVKEMTREIFGNDEELLIIAMGHDLLEETKYSERDLFDQGFSERVILGILALTKLPGQSYEDYKRQVLSNKDAIKVKISDLKHNSDLSRLKRIDPKDLDRRDRYQAFREELIRALLG